MSQRYHPSNRASLAAVPHVHSCVRVYTVNVTSRTEYRITSRPLRGTQNMLGRKVRSFFALPVSTIVAVQLAVPSVVTTLSTVSTASLVVIEGLVEQPEMLDDEEQVHGDPEDGPLGTLHGWRQSQGLHHTFSTLDNKT